MPTAESPGGIAFALAQAGKRYGKVRALERVSLTFAAGTTTALIGSSGSGKSTVLRLLLGLEWPDHGHVEVDGQPLQRNDVLPLRRRSLTWRINNWDPRRIR